MPLVYVVYGMAKSGSALAFRLSQEILMQSGHDQALLPRMLIGDRRENFLRDTKVDTMRGALALAGSERKATVAVKTHTGLRPRVADLIGDDEIGAVAVARDPRDIACAILESARHGGAWSLPGGEPVHDIEGAMSIVRNHVTKFLSWAEHDNVITLSHTDLTQHTVRAARHVAVDLGLNCDAVAAAEAVLGGETSLPTQEPRHLRDMSEEAVRYYGKEFEHFIETYCRPTLG
jgi:hypothetical protein